MTIIMVLCKNSVWFLIVGMLFAICGEAPALAQIQTPTLNIPTSQGSSPSDAITCVFHSVTTPGIDGYHLTLTGYFNNDPTKHGTFVLDTAASYSLLSSATALRLGLLPVPAYFEGKRAMLGNIPVSTTTMPGFKVNPIDIISQPPLDLSGTLGVVPDSFLASVVNTPIDGLIGADIFTEFNTVIDFLSGKISFFQPGPLASTRLAQFGMDAAQAIPLTVKANGVPYVSLHLEQGDKKANAEVTVDTGSVYTDISHQTAQSLGLKPTKKQMWSIGANGPYKTNQAILDTLQVGDQTLHHVPVYYPDVDMLAPGFSLGTDILQRFRMLLSISDKRLYLKSNMPLPTVVTTPPQTQADTK